LLYAFDAVVLDDLEAAFFTRKQMDLLKRFVSERGGGLLMLGGKESFREGGYNDTPVGSMLPLYLDYASEAPYPRRFQLALTRDGWLQPWVRLRREAAAERTRLDALPAHQVLNRMRDVKPGAQLLAEVEDERGQRWPALIVQRFGLGRTAALTVGDFWRSGFGEAGRMQDMGKAWRQIIRWLVSDTPARVELENQPRLDLPGAAQELLVHLRDNAFQPVDGAQVRVRAGRVEAGQHRPGDSAGTGSEAESFELSAEPDLSEPGLYRATFVPRKAGAYRAEATAVDGQGQTIGSAQTGWSSDPFAEEYNSIRINRPLLDELAAKTGGEVLTWDDLEGFGDRLFKRPLPVMEAWTFPLWHNSILFIAAIGCLVGEWGLRRLWGLP